MEDAVAGTRDGGVRVGLSRGAIYYEPRPLSERDLQLMRRIDELQLPPNGRRHVATLMKRMGIEAIYRRKNISQPHPEHRVYPYLPRRLTVD